MDTTYNIVKGLQIPRGLISPYFIIDPERAETVMEKPHILIADREIYSPQELIPILDKVIKSGNRQLLIITDDVRAEALATLIVNKLKGNALFVAVKAPYIGSQKTGTMTDIAELTGATIITSELGKKLEDATLEDLGTADKVIITKDTTTIIGGRGANVEDHIKKLRAMMETTVSELDKDKMKERIAKLTSGVAVIKVGGATENEMRALRYKVEDAVNASKVAFKNGVVRGAGITLQEIDTGSSLLNKALKYPYAQLLENMEVASIAIGDDIIDPVEVLIAGVESAISIVSLLITTKGILVEENEPNKSVGD